MKKILAFFLTLSMLLALAACGGTSPSGQKSVSSLPEASSQAPESSGAAADSKQKVDNETAEYYLQKADEVVVTDTQVTFTDDTGRGELSVDKNPKKVAVLYGSLA